CLRNIVSGISPEDDLACARHFVATGGIRPPPSAAGRARFAARLTVTIVSCNVRFMARKNELCGRALDYCLAHGISELSLRPLALQIGTSARLLIYHFGSRDGLIGAVMDEAHRRVQKSFGELMRGAANKGVLRKFWDWTTDPRNSPYLRLMFEVQMLALQNPAAYTRYLQGT